MTRFLVIAGLLSPQRARAGSSGPRDEVERLRQHVRELPLFRRTTAELAWHIAVLATKADVILLQEYCTGEDANLERELKTRTGRGVEHHYGRG